MKPLQNTNTIFLNDMRDIFDQEFTLSFDELKTNTIGLVIYYIVFVFSIPYYLYHNNQMKFLQFYIPNLNIIANILSFDGGPSQFKLFNELYKPIPNTIYSYISSTIINYISLLGITYMIARETKIKNNIFAGWSIGFITLLITYLLANQFISEFMEIVYNVFISFGVRNKSLLWLYSAFFGLLFTYGIIQTETYLVQQYREKLQNIGIKLFQIPKKIKQFIQEKMY